MDANALQPFDAYIAECAAHIKDRRTTHQHHAINPEAVITANCPFELQPDNKTPNEKFRYGVLLVHGLLDSPFSLRDLGTHFQHAGILSRAVLLPGHGSRPNDLLQVKYQEWIDAVRYGVDSLRHVAETIFLVGYSTGATLSIYHALNDSSVQGVILLAPALKILPPVSTIVKWPVLSNFFSREDKWLCQDDEIDYAKYESVPFNPIIELGKLIETIKKENRSLSCPMMMVMSLDDETVSPHAALRYFTRNATDDSRFMLYTTEKKHHTDERILLRNPAYPKWHIKQMSHIALPFAPENPHYGQQGDYPNHSDPHASRTIYGAYNNFETRIYDRLYKLGMVKKRRATLTYNPDFDYMAERIVEFIKM